MKPLKNKTNTVPPGGDYPFGDLRDNPGDNSGTPVDRNLLGDIHRTIEKMMDVSGIVANNLDDNEANGYQVYDAFVKAIRGYRITTIIFNPDNPGSVITVIRDELNLGTPTTTKTGTGTYEVVWSVSKPAGYLLSLSLFTSSIEGDGFILPTFKTTNPSEPLKITTKSIIGAVSDVTLPLNGVIIEIRDYN